MRTNNLFKALLLLGALSFSSHAFSAKDQFYLFTDIGTSANTDYSFTEANSPLITNDINYTSYRLGGGYAALVSEHVSLGGEVAYNYYGDEQYNFFNLDQIKISFSATDVLLVTAYHFNEQWEVHGKIGGAYEEVVVTENYFSGNVTTKEWVPEAAAGLSYHFNEHISVHGDFSYLAGWVSGLNDMPDITVGWLGVSYAF